MFFSGAYSKAANNIIVGLTLVEKLIAKSATDVDTEINSLRTGVKLLDQELLALKGRFVLERQTQSLAKLEDINLKTKSVIERAAGQIKDKPSLARELLATARAEILTALKAFKIEFERTANRDANKVAPDANIRPKL